MRWSLTTTCTLKLLDELERLRAVGGREHVVVRAEDRAQRVQYALLVVHEQDARLLARPAPARRRAPAQAARRRSGRRGGAGRIGAGLELQAGEQARRLDQVGVDALGRARPTAASGAGSRRGAAVCSPRCPSGRRRRTRARSGSGPGLLLGERLVHRPVELRRDLRIDRPTGWRGRSFSTCAHDLRDCCR